MKAYGNKAGNSGVSAYEAGRGRITVRFVDGTDYTYTNASAGEANVRHMKALAENGRGLSTFISTTVKNKYESKR